MVMRFTVPGEPKGKGRPRLGRSGHAYTPHDTAQYENLVKLCFTAQYPDFPMMEGNIWVGITAFYKIPKSVSKKKAADMASGLIRPMKKPDLDNVAKIVCDSLNGIAYVDDSQVTTLVVRKYYSHDPHVEVSISYDGE